jgi:hypothetical protein
VLDYSNGMTTPRFVAWMLGAWLTPALVGGVLGWHGIWGSGSAFTDYLIPIPVAGGALHVPSFVVALVTVRIYPRLSSAGAARLRAVCVGTALMGLALLIDLQRVFLGATTDLPIRAVPWQANPLGLFVVSDALWALACMLRTPSPASAVASSVFIALLLPALYVAGALSSDRHLQDRFVMGRSEYQPDRGDEVRWVYTRLAVTDAAFQDAALAFVDALRPQHDANSEDVAIFFTDSLDTARSVGNAAALTTLCLYEDGTADRWFPGQHDCFGDHVSFSNRIAALGRNIPPTTPRDVAAYLIARAACADVAAAASNPNEQAAQTFCGHMDLPAMHNALQHAYPNEQLSAWLAEP